MLNRQLYDIGGQGSGESGSGLTTEALDILIQLLNR